MMPLASRSIKSVPEEALLELLLSEALLVDYRSGCFDTALTFEICFDALISGDCFDTALLDVGCLSVAVKNENEKRAQEVLCRCR